MGDFLFLKLNLKLLDTLKYICYYGNIRIKDLNTINKSQGGIEKPLTNGKGVQTIFDDGSRVIYRVNTSTPNSPAIDIKITIYSGIKKQKIHFIK